MKNKSIIPGLAAIIMLASLFTGCEKEEEHVAVPISPILKEIIMPSEENSIPGTEVTIYGKGFGREDKVFLTAEDQSTGVEVEVVIATDDFITFNLPADLAGLYTVSIERDGKTTVLSEKLSVPYLVIINNLVAASGNYSVGETVTIQGQGFQTGDSIRLFSDTYPEGLTFELEANSTDENISFVVPANTYGINSIVVYRGLRKSIVGSIGIKASVGDEIGGGVVFWVDADNVHGYIINRTNCGTPTEYFGPAVAIEMAGGTSVEIGSGKDNTQFLVNQISSYRGMYDDVWDTQATAAELCANLEVVEGDLTYDDWFLPSQLELKEVFLQKAMLSTKGAAITANNFWSSSEGPGNEAGWAAYYVNFYENTNFVSDYRPKQVWRIGVRAIRSF